MPDLVAWRLPRSRRIFVRRTGTDVKRMSRDVIGDLRHRTARVERDDVKAAALLELMLTPWRFVSRVDEESESLDGHVQARHVTVHFSDDLVALARGVAVGQAAPNGVVAERSDAAQRAEAGRRRIAASGDDAHSSAWVDIMHPRKGKLRDLTFVGASAAARRLDHIEHQLLAEFLILYRFTSILEGAAVPAGEEARFVDAMIAALPQLIKIPSASPPEAARLIDEVFDLRARTLKVAFQVPGTATDGAKVAGLLELCEMFAERYLVVVEVDVHDGVDNWLSYTITQAVEEQPRITDPRDMPPYVTRWWLKFGNWLRRVFGVPPVVTRVHVPWAKRTDHYTLRVPAPEGYFFSVHEIFASPRDEPTRYQAHPPAKGVEWSRTTNAGHQAHAFVGNGSREDPGRSLNVRYQVLERPGRSTLRLAITSALVSIASSVVFVSTILKLGDGSNDVPALVVAVLSLVAFVLEAAMPSLPNAYGTPLSVRLGTLALVVLSLALALWVMLKQDRVTAVWYVSDIPGLCLCVLMLGVASYISWRLVRIVRTHSRVSRRLIDSADNMS